MDDNKMKVGTAECPEIYATFLQQVQSGELSKISPPQNEGIVRINVQREPSYSDCNYIYSYR